MAVSWLHHCFGDACLDLDIPLITELKQSVGESKLRTLIDPSLMDSLYPKTSSLGRLFDAIAAIVSFGTKNQFEGQAAMELEWSVNSHTDTPYHIDIVSKHDTVLLDPRSMFTELIHDVKARTDSRQISSRFHTAIVDLFHRCCQQIRSETGMSAVALSGGCFQNSILFKHLSNILSADGFNVLSHSKVPCNDGGVALGQAVIANEQA